MVVQKYLGTRLVGQLRTEAEAGAELSKQGILGTRAVQPTFLAGPTSNTTVLYVDSVPLQRETACLDLFQFWTHPSIQ